MRVAIICLRGKSAAPEDQWAAKRARRLAALDEAQALGIARAMRDRGRLAPLLVFEKGSPLEQKALEYGIPCLLWGFFSRFQLWRWQRKHSRLIIQTVGQESMPVGRMLLKMRKKDTAILAHAFFLKAPEGKNLTGKAMRAASRVLCGSGHVAERISEGLAKTIKTIIDRPGIGMESWLPCRPWRAAIAVLFLAWRKVLSRSPGPCWLSGPCPRSGSGPTCPPGRCGCSGLARVFGKCLTRPKILALPQGFPCWPTSPSRSFFPAAMPGLPRVPIPVNIQKQRGPALLPARR